MKTFDEVWAQAQVPGHLPIEDGRLLWDCAAIAAERHPALPFLEIGSFQGKSTILLAHHAPVVMIEPSWLWNGGSIDGLVQNAYRYTERKVDEASRAALLKNTSNLPNQCHLIPQPSSEVFLGNVFMGSDPTLALIFIDGDHTEGGVDVDCANFLPHLASGGIACFHDYTLPEYPVVVQSVNAFTHNWYTLAKAGSLLAKVKP